MDELSLGFILLSFFAGMLTILSPCVLPLLPLIISGVDEERSLARPLAIILSLGASIIVFTLLLKASTDLIGIPDTVWQWFSGGVLLVFGLLTLMPTVWAQLVSKLRLEHQAQKLLGSGLTRRGWGGHLIVGFSLGPIFFSCSPTYAGIIAVALPASPVVGLIYLLIYVVGLMLVLLAIGLGGQWLAGRLGFLSNPQGRFKRLIGVLLVLTGLAIVTGFYKDIEAWVLSSGVYDPLIDLELDLAPDRTPVDRRP